ncbi:hypothetical protein [Streptomyces sp. NPDC056049]|uniref:hypothetical protein n=1 Tax=Streptomyces sp. NPDC056049 TaxID=3345693 RepID=UPI0035DEC11C
MNLRPFETTLAQATTSAEVSATVLAALGAAEQVITDLSTVLSAAGDRYSGRPLIETRRLLWTAASSLLVCMDDATAAVTIALRGTYEPSTPPTPKSTAPGLPPTPPGPAAPGASPSGPTPSR